MTDIHGSRTSNNEQLPGNVDESLSSESVDQFDQLPVQVHRSTIIPTKKSRESIPYKVR